MSVVNTILTKVFGSNAARELKKIWPVVEVINSLEESVKKLSDESLQDKTIEFKSRLEKGAIIIFDEFYGYPNWKNHEFKAFQEVFNENEYSYIGFSQRQAVVKIN